MRNRLVWILGCAAAVLGGLRLAGAASFVPMNAERFFVEPGERTELVWKSSVQGAVTYRVTDYEGKAVTEGQAEVGVDGTLTVPLKVGRGYYDVALGASGEKYGVVALEAYRGERDGFFGMDAVLNWLDRREAMRTVMVRGMNRIGLAMARERINWDLVEPKAGQWNWEEPDHAWGLRQIYEREGGGASGMKVLEMFHSPGPARGAFPVRNNYPQNLVELSQAWPVIYEKFKGTWGGLEVWNEPEGGYGSQLPADEYVPMVKAMRWAFEQKGIDSPIGAGAFVGGDPGVFHEFCGRNGMLDAVDFVSVHDYHSGIKMERLMAVHRAWLKRFGREGMPLWVTECGWSWPKGGGRPEREADGESALEISMKGAEAKACGAVRYMPFCLAFYEEGGSKSFSMLGKDVTPLRSMGAYAQSVRVLSGKSYVGDLVTQDPAIMRARVFEGKGERVVVVYTDEMKGGATVGLPVKATRVEGIDGRELSQDSNGKIVIPDGMAYVWTQAGEVKRDTAAMALLEASKKGVGAKQKMSPVVLQYVVDAEQESYSPTQYVVKEAAAGELQVKVRVHNLGAKAQGMTLWVKLPGEDAAAAKGRKQAVDLAGESVKEVRWTVDARGKLGLTEALPLVVGGELAEGGAVSELALPMLGESPLDAFTKVLGKMERLDIGEVVRWKKNLAAGGDCVFSREDDGTWKMTTDYQKAGDHWVYPKFQLAARTLTGAKGFVVRARAQEATVRMMLFEKGGEGFWTADGLMPADGAWHVVYVPLERFEPLGGFQDKGSGQVAAEHVTDVSVGMHERAKSMKNALEVSDLLVVREKGKELP